MDEEFPVVDSCYAEERYARKREEHLREQDGVFAVFQPVTIDFYPAPKTYDDAEVRAGWDYAAKAVRTVGKGAMLHDYGGPSRPISLPEVGAAVSDAWTAWREAQLASGNLEEAGREPPAELRSLFEERQGQLELFPRGLP